MAYVTHVSGLDGKCDGACGDAAHEFCIYRTPFEDCGYPSTVKLDDGSFLTIFYAYPRRGVPAALTGVKWRPGAVTVRGRVAP